MGESKNKSQTEENGRDSREYKRRFVENYAVEGFAGGRVI